MNMAVVFEENKPIFSFGFYTQMIRIQKIDEDEQIDEEMDGSWIERRNIFSSFLSLVTFDPMYDVMEHRLIQQTFNPKKVGPFLSGRLFLYHHLN